MRQFFLFCSGANFSVLDECPEEQGKYAGIGATVFGTAVLASLSGGYAFFTVFREVVWAVGFGILWGLIIFNLDRVIVSTMRRQKRWSLEFVTILPRLALAILIGIVIARPLELKLYEREINGEIARRNNARYNDTVRTIDTGYARLADLERQNAELQQEIDTKQKEVEVGFQRAVSEAEGTAGTKRAGKGPVFAEKWQRQEEMKRDLADLSRQHRAQIKRNTDEITRLRSERQARIDSTARIEGEADGMLARMDALESLATSSSTVRVSSLFITLLFIFVEVSPVLVKVMAGLHSYRPYEQKLEDRELQRVEASEAFRLVLSHTLRVLAEKQISDFNSDVNCELQLNADQNQKRHELQLRANQELMEQIAAAQAEIAARIVEEWKSAELQNVTRNLQQYVS